MNNLLILTVWITCLLLPVFGQLPIFGLECLGGQPTDQGTFQYSFRVTITNPRTTPITNVIVTLQQPQAFVGNVPSIAAGATQTLLGTVNTATSAPRIGPAILSARTFPDLLAIAAQSGTAQCPPAVTRVVDLRVTKNCTASLTMTDTGAAEIQVCFDVFVTNVGNVPFTSVSVVENIGPPLFQPVGGQALPVGATIRLSGCFTPENQNEEFFTNSVSVFAVAEDELEAREFGPAVATCPRPIIVSNPQLQVSKNCSTVLVGGQLRVRFDVFITNVGNVPFSTLTLLEQEVGGASPQSFIISTGLAVGATTSVNSFYVPSNPNAMAFQDQVTVQAVPASPPGATAISFPPALATCANPFFGIPDIDIFKNCTVTRSGNQIVVRFTVILTNVGTVPFSSLSVLEQELGGGAPQTFIVSSGLGVGRSATVMGSYVPTDQNAANFMDEVRVIGQPSMPPGASPTQFGPVTASCPNPFR